MAAIWTAGLWLLQAGISCRTHLSLDEVSHPRSHAACDVSNDILVLLIQAKEDLHYRVELRHEVLVVACTTLHAKLPA